MKIDKFRSTICYRVCGRIGVFILPFAFIVTKWCKVISGPGYEVVFGLLALVPFWLISTTIFIILNSIGFAQSKKIQTDKIENNLVADIGYIMYVILVLFGLFIIIA